MKRKSQTQALQLFLSQRPRETVSLAVLLGTGLLVCSHGMAQTANRPAPTVVPQPSTQWVQKGNTGATYDVTAGSVNGNPGAVATARIKGPSTVLSWDHFDLGRNAQLNMVLDSSTARVLNKVLGGVGVNRSTVIDGILQSNGQVYIYNPNGILFGKDSQVNVNALVGTTLKIDDDRFMSGMLKPSTSATFAADGLLPVNPGAIVVESGLDDAGVLKQAAITAEKNGLIMLLAPQVTNEGQLSAPDGQVLLAAGSKVYLAAPNNTAMRGFRVEVSGEGLQSLASVTNASRGVVSVERGNATLAGMLVNQQGMVSATTSVNLNGSIILKATHGAQKSGLNAEATSTLGGSLVLGQGSVTQVTPVALLKDPTKPEAGYETAVSGTSGTAFKQSTIDLSGHDITLAAGASVLAPSGKVTLAAGGLSRAGQDAEQQRLDRESSTVRFEAGSLVDVSGTKGMIEQTMESNVISVELRGGELADNVLLRNASGIRGKSVRVDKRKLADVKMANLSGYANLLESDIGQFTTKGGEVAVTSQGSIAQEQNSEIRVSGGWTDYADGHVNTTKLSLNGRLYDMPGASAELAYDGLVNLGNSSSNFEKGYREGNSAGTVSFNAPEIRMAGNLEGKVAAGIYQRDVTSAKRPMGGELRIGSVGSSVVDPSTGQTRFSALLEDEFAFADDITVSAVAPEDGLHLNLPRLADQGFTRITAVTVGNIEVNDWAHDSTGAWVHAPLSMPHGSTLRLGAGNHLNWQASANMRGTQLSISAYNGLSIGRDDASTTNPLHLNLSGVWQNDLLDAAKLVNADGQSTADVVTAGGAFRAYANQLSVADGVSIDVSGGAWLDTKGALSKGRAGAIALQAVSQNNNLSDATLTLAPRVGFYGYGMANGGSLSLTGRDVQIGGEGLGQGDLSLSTRFFAQGGFASRSITANGNLTVADNVVVTSLAESLVLSDDHALRASGDLYNVLNPTGPSVAHVRLWGVSGPSGQQRQASNLSLTARGSPDLPGDTHGLLTVGRGAQLLVDPGAKIALTAGQRVYVDGTLRALGGSLSLQLSATANRDYNPSRSIWLGNNARLLAGGTDERVYIDQAGVATGDVLSGGTVDIWGISNEGRMETAVGYVVTERGSIIDASGVQRTGLRRKSGGRVLDAATEASAGGTVNVMAREGLVMDGSLVANPGNDKVHGGSLYVTLDRENNPGSSGSPTVARNLTITGSSTDVLSEAGQLSAGDSLDRLAGQGWLSTRTFNEGGFGTLRFKSQDVLTLAGNGAGGSGTLFLSALRGVELNAPVLRAAVSQGGQATQVQIQAPQVVLGNSDKRYQAAQAPGTDGLGLLSVHAKVVDLIGDSATEGFGRVDLNAEQDIRLIGMESLDEPAAFGAFRTGAQLDLTAAQVYPTTLTQFALSLNGDDTTLAFHSNGRQPGTLLSAAGQLSAQADHINQAGRVYAPFGAIHFSATQDINYLPGSVTSVAGQGVVPFGSVVNGTDWTYTFNGTQQTMVLRGKPSSDPALAERGLPTKEISSQAPVVDQAQGALLDLSGGGNLYAYEFSPGPGGSADVLNSTGSNNQNFAINVNYRSSVAPVDWQNGQDGLAVGDQVYLSGGPGLTAGYYTLLPAHYALLEGGLQVTSAANNTKDMSPLDNHVRADGAYTIAGYRSSAMDERQDPRWTGFVVSPQSLVRKRSEFADHQATTFFTDAAKRLGQQAPELPKDAGHATFSVVNKLVLDGTTRMSGATAVSGETAGLNGLLDISAPLIAVTARADGDVGNYLNLSAADLNAVGARSVLLGGTRTNENDGVHLNVNADIVRIDNDAAHALRGTEWLLAAKDTVQLTSRAVIETTGSPGDSTDTYVVNGEGANADGALLRISGGTAANVVRGVGNRDKGRLEIGQGAQLLGNAVELDATASMSFDGSLGLSRGATLSISGSKISLGDQLPQGLEGLTLNDDVLRSFSQLGALTLGSQSTMDFYGSVDLGSFAGRYSLASLTLRASSLRSFDATVNVAADTVHLQGGAQGEQAQPATAAIAPASTSASIASTAYIETMTAAELDTGLLRAIGGQVSIQPTAGTISVSGTSVPVITTTSNLAAGNASVGLSGSVSLSSPLTSRLNVQARQITLGNGDLQVQGFDHAALQAEQSIRAVGKQGALSASNNLTLSGRQITTDAGAAGLFTAGGALVMQASNANAPSALGGLGGHLAFKGDTVQSNMDVQAQGGRIEFEANNDLHITGGTLDVSGRQVAFGSTSAAAPAGTLTLQSQRANVQVDAPTVLNMSAHNAAAGTLQVNVGGSKASINATMLAEATGQTQTGLTPQQGSFVMDAKQAMTETDFGNLNASLNEAGMTQLRRFRFGQGDVTLGAQDLIRAHEVEVSVDDGNLTIEGTIDARGDKGGTINLSVAQQDASGDQGQLTIKGGALLDARAVAEASSVAGSLGDGGTVWLSAANANGDSNASLRSGATVWVEADAAINVSGSGMGRQGLLHIRAPRVGDEAGSDVGVGSLQATVVGARSVTLEGVKTYMGNTISEGVDSGTNLDASEFGQMATDASNFSQSEAAILARLGRSDLPVNVTAGVEVRSDGDLTVSVNEQSSNAADRGWNLNSWRFGGKAGTLSLRAAGNLTIQGSISDGFEKDDSLGGMSNWRLSASDQSWSYRLVGGADLLAANSLAVKQSNSTGDVKLTFAHQLEADKEAPVAMIRTGTGRIDMAAGRDIVLDTQTLPDPDGDRRLDQVIGAAVYTAGRAAALAPGFVAPVNNTNPLVGASLSTSAQFGVDGGGIAMVAQRDVSGAPATQLVNQWLFRQGRSGLDANGNLVFEKVGSGPTAQTLNTAWWSRTDYFDQGVATLGGGDVKVAAVSGSVKDLSVSVASNAYVPGDSPQGAALHEQGGGDLTIHAGLDIQGGSYYVQKGTADLHAQNDIKPGSAMVYDEGASNQEVDVFKAVGPIIALGDAKVELTAGNHLDIETIYNPTYAKQSNGNVAGILGQLDPNSGDLLFDNTTSSAIDAKARYGQFSMFSTYTADSAVAATSVGGNVLLSNNLSLVAGLDDPSLIFSGNWRPYFKLFGYAPPTLKASALTGSLTSGGGFALAPAANGNLSLLANQSVSLAGWNRVFDGVVMLDSDPAATSSPLQPTLVRQADLNVIGGSASGLASHMAGSLHGNDSTPVTVIANQGSIIGSASQAATLTLPKMADIRAGTDIRDLGFVIQHNNASDVTSLVAARDIIDSTNVEQAGVVKHVITGQGQLAMFSGRDLDLGNAQGVVTRGNLDNPYLTEGGASVLAMAGADLHRQNAEDNPFNTLRERKDFFNALTMASKLESLLKLEVSGATLDASDPTALISFNEALVKAFPEIFTQQSPVYSDADLQSPTQVARILAQYDQVIRSALTELSPGTDLTGIKTSQALAHHGFDAVLTHLYPTYFQDGSAPSELRSPGDHPYLGAFDRLITSAAGAPGAGDIKVFGSQVKTEQGGSIDLIAPGGSVVAGLVSVPSYLTSKAKSENGIFTVRGGDVRVLVKNDFLVNQGRVFTLGGGDITMISQYGNIDAGRGSKTASSAPPPLLTTDASGNTKLDISGSIAGSGIAALQTREGQLPSNIAAVAPRGIFDAGDAGVRSTGKVSIQAAVVLNASNIAAAGGVSSSASLGISSVSSGPAAATSNTASDAAKQLSVAPKETLALTVEVLGYGSGGDEEDEDEETKRRKKAKKS